MSARCSLVVNGKAVRISTGDTPVEAALAEGMIGSGSGLHGANPFGQGFGRASARLRAGASRAFIEPKP